MIHYFKRHKWDIVIIAVVALLLSAFKLAYHIIGVDTEAAIVDFDACLNWIIGCGRFASVLFQKILMPFEYGYKLSVIYSVIGWIAVGVAYHYCFTKLGVLNKHLSLLFSLLCMTNPIWASQSYFTALWYVWLLGMFLSIIAAYQCVTIFTQKFRLTSLLSTALLSVLVIGIYQALLFFLVGNTIIFLTLFAHKQKESIPAYLIAGIKCICVLVVSVLLFFAISNLSISIFYDPSVDYLGHTNALKYTSNRIAWAYTTLSAAIDSIFTYFKSTYAADTTYGLPIWPFLFALTLLSHVVALKRTKNCIMIIGQLLLLLCTFMECFLLGSGITTREQVVLPLLIAYCAVTLMAHLFNYSPKSKRWVRIIRYIAMVCCTSIILLFGSKQMFLNYSDYLRYEADISLATEISNDIHTHFGDIKNQKIIFTGKNKWTPPEYSYTGDLIGHSIFNWDASTTFGANYRSWGFMYSCGFEYQKPSLEDIQTVKQLLNENVIVFSEDERVLVKNGYTIVNLDSY